MVPAGTSAGTLTAARQDGLRLRRARRRRGARRGREGERTTMGGKLALHALPHVAGQVRAAARQAAVRRSCVD